MKIEFLSKLEKYSRLGKIANFGLTEGEVIHIESRLGFRFPQAYRELLYLAGRSTPLFDEWQRCFVDEYFQIQVSAGLAEVCVNNEKFWVFLCYHDEEQLMFFYLNESDDPAVYGFYDMRPGDENVPFMQDDFEIKKLYYSLSDCVNYWLKIHIKSN